MIQELENRTLLSASIANGTLLINGTNRNDTIHVQIDGPWLVVFENVKDRKLPAAGVERIIINGRGGDDFILHGAGDIPAMIVGGQGDDVLSGALGSDKIFGGAGSDKLFGHGGDDILDGGLGDDQFSGGEGTDTAVYSTRRKSLAIFLDGTPSGENGESDVLQGIENVIGGHGDDLLIGNSADNVLVGGKGNDTLDGGAGGDVLYGTAGADVLLVRDGEADQAWGGRGRDTAAADSLTDNIAGVESVLDEEAAALRLKKAAKRRK